MNVFKPPSSINLRSRDQKSVFLAGSIENGKAVDWQSNCENQLSDSFEILNPRRKEWNSDWNISIEGAQFYQQVDWELNALEKADFILFYFAPGNKSPISLLELGLFARSKKVVVVCPNGFWRKGNVDMICVKFDIPQFDTLEEAGQFLKK